MALIDISLSACRYGKVEVLHDVNIEVRAGEMVAVLGNNGVGKTTLLRAISGVEVRVDGVFTFEDTDISKIPAHKRMRRGVIHVPEGRRIFGELTVDENLKVGAMYANSQRSYDDRRGQAYELFPALTKLEHRPGAALSGGEQQMLAIARGLMADPKLLMVDEASLGLAPLPIKTVFAALSAIRDSGVAVLVVEQNVRTSLAAADRAYVLERGTISQSGSSSELLADPKIVDAYLGSADNFDDETASDDTTAKDETNSV